MLEKFIGLTGDENTLFETLLFEVESNYDFYNSNWFDILLKPLEGKQFQINEVVSINKDLINAPPPHAEYMKKISWFTIHGKSNRTNLILRRIDLTVKSAVIFEDGNTDIYLVGSMIDPDAPPRPRMTEEEIRLGIQELCGFVDNHIDANSKSKKAM